MFKLVILASITASSGCSMLIAMCGKNLNTLETRDDYVAAFGKPVEVKIVDGEMQEVFRTRQKIAQSFVGPGEGMLIYLTAGFSELITIPYELYRTAKWSVMGLEVAVSFDTNGRVERYSCERDPIGCIRRHRTREPLPDLVGYSPPKTLSQSLRQKLPLAAESRS